MPADDSIPQTGEAGGEGEDERGRTIAPGESAAEDVPLVEGRSDPVERPIRQPGVGMQEKQNLATGRRRAAIHLSSAVRFGQRDDAATCFLGDRPARILAPSVHDHDLARPALDPPEAFGERGAFICHRDDD